MARIFRALGRPEAPSSDEHHTPIPRRAEQAFWGRGFSRRDPEGNVWDVAWAEGSTFDDRGGLKFP